MRSVPEESPVPATTFTSLKSVDAIEKAIEFLLVKVDAILPDLIKNRSIPITSDDICRIRATLNSGGATSGLLSELFYLLEEVRKNELVSDLKCKSLQKSLEKVSDELSDANFILSKYRKKGGALETNKVWSTDIRDCISAYSSEGDNNDILAVVEAETIEGNGSGAKVAIYRDGSVRIRQKYSGTGYKVGDVLRVTAILHDTDGIDVSSDGSVTTSSQKVCCERLFDTEDVDDASSVTSIQSAEIVSSKLSDRQCSDNGSTGYIGSTGSTGSSGCEFVSIIVITDVKETGSSAFVQVTLSESKIGYNSIVGAYYKYCSIPGNDLEQEKLRLEAFRTTVNEFGEYIALKRFARPET